MSSKIKIFIVAILSLCGINTQAQFIYFDSLYDSGLNINEEIASEALEEYQLGIYSVISSSANPFALGQLYYFETASDGHRIKEILIENDIPGRHYAKNLIIISDSLALTASSFTDTIGQKQKSLTQFNRYTGEVIWRKYYGSLLNADYCAHFIKTYDAGYAITGQSVDSVDAQINLIKTDSNGNQQWENYYGGVGYESSRSLIQTPDSGFMLLGWTQSFGQRKIYLVKTDSLGNQQWQRTYASGGTSSGWGIIALEDGNYLLTGSSGDGSGNSKGVLIKVSPLGDMIWSKDYTYQNLSGNNLSWSKELNDNSLISVGMTHDNNDAGFLIKTDSAGNLLWQRRYNKNNDTDLFYSIIETSDGGFLLGGQARNVQPFNQDAWLLKVDSLGCPYADCTVGIDEQNKKVLVDVYPNPASDLLNVELQENNDYDLTLTDLQGKVIYASTTLSMTSTIDVSGFADGVYLLTLQNEEQRTTLKIIIQH